MNYLKYSDYFKLKNFDKVFHKINTIKSIEKLKQFQYQKFCLGAHSYAATVRFFANPNIELENTFVKIFQAYIKSSIIALEVIKNIDNKYNFTHIVLDHGIYVPQGVIAEYFKEKKKNITTFAAETRNKSFIFSKNQSYHYEMVKKINLKNINLTRNKKIKTLNFLSQKRSGKNHWILFQEKSKKTKINLNEDKINIAIFTNVLWDAKIHFKENVFDSCEDWVLKTIEIVKQYNLKNINLHIRVHPGEKKGFVKSRYFLAPLINNFNIKNKINFVKVYDSSDDVNSYELAKKCDYSICYASKIAFELAAIGVKVITTGDAWTRNKEITHDIISKKEYIKTLTNINSSKYKYKLKNLNAIKFAFYYIFIAVKEIDFLNKKKGNPPFYIKQNQIYENKSLKKVISFLLN